MSLRLNRYILILLAIFFASPAGTAHALTLKSVEFAHSGSEETVVITLSDKAAYKLFLVSDPDRLVIDLPTAEFPGRKEALKNYEGRLIKSLRFGQNNEEHSRLVFDLSEHPKSLSATMMPDGQFTRIEIQMGAKQQFVASSRVPTAGSRETHTSGDPAVKPRDDELKPMIVIDPGHGGQDPGTLGRSGTQEKDITLALARKLQNELLQTGRFRVQLTRNEDVFILLRDRFQIARKLGAQMFISLHANSEPSGAAHGISVYSLSDQASDAEAAGLASRENKADLIAGMDLNGASPDVTNILIDLAQHQTNSKSVRLADYLVRALKHYVALLQNTHRSAGFAVLKAPDIASVLVEAGFLTNAKEERLLNTDGYQVKIAKGLADGIDAYFKKGIRH